MAEVRDQASSSSSSISDSVYDVFLSFRGADTGKNFTDHLYKALTIARFHTFRDDAGIERGEYILQELEKAIKQSRISIIVFSKTYATSRWCLDELVKILHCKKKVLPIFYDVNPSEVCKQTGSFADAFSSHENRFEANKVKQWRAALKDVSKVAGMELKDGHQADFIEKIVKVIRDNVNRRGLSIAPFLIGIESQVEKINLWLQDETMDASVLTICGMGGVGKTTIATYVYNLNQGKFDASSFLGNIRERSQEPNGIVNLQKQLLSDIGRDEKVRWVGEGIVKIEAALRCCKRLLLVLDDVDQVNQLKEMFGMRPFSSPGSKIIITTRKESLLNPRDVHHKKHKIEPFSYKESLELFSWHAFGQAHPTKDYLNHSKRVVDHCGGLPLAVQVLGSSFSGIPLNMWKSALEKLVQNPDSQILGKLKISDDSLQDDLDKDLFLDIACFFVGWDRDWTIKILDECDCHPTIGIQNLIDRCLVTVDMRNKLTMHQLLQDMGREIVRLESPKEPGERSRIWRHKDSLDVLREKTGTNKIEGVILDMHMFEEDEPEEIDLGSSLKHNFLSVFYRDPVDSSSRKLVETDEFAKMPKLRLLQLNYVQVTGCFEKFPKRLRWLCWHGFPFTFIPSDFPMERLVTLDMHYSSLKQVWKRTKFLKRLKRLDLTHSHGLTETPDFSGIPNLEILILEDCVSLTEVHESIVKVEGLILLNLKDCKNLKKLPRNICMLKFLETVDLSGCTNLKWSPTELMRTQEEVQVQVQPWHAIIWSNWVSNPKRSPESTLMCLPCSLVKLSLAGCNVSDDAFPLDLSKLSLLKYLDLSNTQILSLPEGIMGLTKLHDLRVVNCRRLKSVTGSPRVRFATRYSSYQGCDNLVEFVGRFKLEPMTEVDVEMLKIWGFLNVESMITNVMVNYYNSFGNKFSCPMKLPLHVRLSLPLLNAQVNGKKIMVIYILYMVLQRLNQFDGGVHSYFIPGNKIPSEFSIKTSTGSSLSFIVPHSLSVYGQIRDVVVCCVYACTTKFFLDYIYPKVNFHLAYITVVNRMKDFRWRHEPVYYGIPKQPNEDMMWISHLNLEEFRSGKEDKLGTFWDCLDGGDELEVSVNCYSRCVQVKEFGILLVYEASQIQQTYSSQLRRIFKMVEYRYKFSRALREIGPE